MEKAGCILLFAALFHVSNGAQPSSRKNVLFIVADDFRTDMNSYFQGGNQPPQTHPVFHTPHLDALASRSLLFKRAYVQFGLCAPSRHSFLTSRRPDTTKTYGFDVYWRKAAGNFTTLPQYFREHGYQTLGFGKVFQHGKKSSNNDDPISWSSPVYRTELDQGYYRTRNTHLLEAIPPEELSKKPLPDEVIADKAIDALRQLAPNALSGKQPFFLAVGFVKPHAPFQYPEEYVKYYDAKDMPLPKNKYQATDSWKLSASDLRIIGVIPELSHSWGFNKSFPNSIIRAGRASYYRSASFMDSMVGKVLEQLSALGLDQSTIVSFIGDHGYHLGEQSLWEKRTLFEVALRTPMIIRMPGITDQGATSSALVEFVDLFPTLVDLAGLPPLPKCPKSSYHIELCTEGASMIPLFCDNDAHFKGVAFSQQGRGKFMGYTVRTDRYRYTEWAQKGPVWKYVKERELYDHILDPDESWNRVDLNEYSTIIHNLSLVLRAGWTAAVDHPHKVAQRIRENGCLRISEYALSYQTSSAHNFSTTIRTMSATNWNPLPVTFNNFETSQYYAVVVFLTTITFIWLAWRRMACNRILGFA